MKRLSVLLAALVVGIVSAQNAQEPQDPKALVKAREAYQKELKRVADPVNQDYLKTLEFLKRDMGTNGDTAGMVAVQREIDAIQALQSTPTGTSNVPLVILKATFGGADVTQKVQKLVRGNRLKIPAERNIFVAKFGDPAHGANKSLIIKYTVAGKENTVTFGEGDEVALP